MLYFAEFRFKNMFNIYVTSAQYIAKLLRTLRASKTPRRSQPYRIFFLQILAFLESSITGRQ
jgi:hypothetical protein